MKGIVVMDIDRVPVTSPDGVRFLEKLPADDGDGDD